MLLLKPPRSNTLEGFVWALVILGAVRIGQKESEDTFLDYDAIRVSIGLDFDQAFVDPTGMILAVCMTA